MDKPFQVQMKTYSVAGNVKPVTANDRDITLPAGIAGDVLDMSGLTPAVAVTPPLSCAPPTA